MVRSLIIPSGTLKETHYIGHVQGSLPLEMLEKQIDKQSMVNLQKNEILTDQTKTKLELEIESEHLNLQCNILDDMINKMADNVQNVQREVSKLKSEIATAEREKDNVIANLHWGAQDRAERQANLIDLQMRIAQYSEESEKLKQESSAIQEEISNKMVEADRLKREQQVRLMQYERLVSSREEELRVATKKEAQRRIDLNQKEQELAIITEKIEELKLEEERIDKATQIEKEIQHKWECLLSHYRNVVEKEARDSVFKLRADFIDEQLRKSKDGGSMTSLQSPDVMSILGQIYQKMEALESVVNSPELRLTRPYPNQDGKTKETVESSKPRTEYPSPGIWLINSDRRFVLENHSPIKRSIRPYRDHSPGSMKDDLNTPRLPSDFEKKISNVSSQNEQKLDRSLNIESDEEENIVTYRDNNDISDSNKSCKQENKKPRSTPHPSQTDSSKFKQWNESLRNLVIEVINNYLFFGQIIALLIKKFKLSDKFIERVKNFAIDQITLDKRLSHLKDIDISQEKFSTVLFSIFEENSTNTKNFAKSLLGQLKTV